MVVRLIDSDALEREYQDRYKLFTWDDGEREKATLARVIQILHEQSTVDVAPVVHAKMMRTDAYPHRIYCGNCYKTLIPNEEYCFEKNEFPKWCMWCGAKLDKGE